ncbi:hypothetical protein ACFP81_12010 [Deinococcus lacus]|uniref:Transposase n=1 Tax=Deinococcus lacus TaxID=392561 RepID=A0ABW1YGR2_9DEIO
MGEAKRRKQLGLMPVSHSFEAVFGPDGVQLLGGPADAAVQAQILEALRRTQPTAATWPAAYRSRHAMLGLPQDYLYTAEDVSRIEVPAYRRVSGEFLQNFDAAGIQNRSEGVAAQFFRWTAVQRCGFAQKRFRLTAKNGSLCPQCVTWTRACST